MMGDIKFTSLDLRPVYPNILYKQVEWETKPGNWHIESLEVDDYGKNVEGNTVLVI